MNESAAGAVSLASPDWLLDQLDPEQRQVALQTHGPLCVRAGAGTGKTRAITYRVAYGAAVGAFDPGQVLAVTFTRKSAAEMQSRLRSLGVGRAKAKTFHSAALQQLRYFWPHLYGRSFPEIKENKASLVVAAATQLGIETSKVTVADLSAEIQWAKVMMIGPDHYEEAAQNLQRPVPADLSANQFAVLYDRYQQARRDRIVVDFEDVLLLCIGLMRTNDYVADQIRKRYSMFVVDEYQDVSPAQQALLDLWLGGRCDLCVVGDAAQTIYSFSGATSHYLLDFPSRYRGAAVIELRRNYRSTPEVVDLANRAIRLKTGAVDPANPTSRVAAGAVHLVSQNSSGPTPVFRTYPTDEAEAAAVAAEIQRLVQGGVPLSEIAILLRTNAQTGPFESALAEAGLSFQVRGGEEFFKREEVRRAILELRRQTLFDRISKETGDIPAGRNLCELVEAAARAQGWTPDAPERQGAARERWDNLNALVTLAKAKGETSLQEFLLELEERAEANAAPTVDGVTITTLHTAKGLEWEAVFLAGLSEGLLPISYATTPAAVAEEQRLFYVGISRARTHLQLSWAQKSYADRVKKRELSRFAKPLWTVGDTAVGATGGAGAGDAAAAGGAATAAGAASATVTDTAATAAVAATSTAESNQTGNSAEKAEPGPNPVLPRGRT